MSAHVAYVKLMNVDNVTGTILDKNDPDVTMKQIANSSIEFRVIIDVGIANTAGNPTIKTYIELEATSGYTLKHLDQTYIVTGN